MPDKSTSPLKGAARILYITGILGLVFALLHLVSYLSSASSLSLLDAGFNALFGLLLLLAGWFLDQGRKVAIIVLVLAVLASLSFGFLVGRGLNFFFLFISGFLVLWVLYLFFRGGFK